MNSEQQHDPLCFHSLNPTINQMYFAPRRLAKDTYFRPPFVEKTNYGYRLSSDGSNNPKQKHAFFFRDVASSDLLMLGEILSVKKFEGCGKASEVVYDLSEIFKESNYEPSSFKSRVIKPRKNASRFGLTVSIATKDDIGDIKKLHDEWVEKKLSDPRVHQISFSRQRYFRCASMALENFFENSTVLLVRDKEGLLVCFEVFPFIDHPKHGKYAFGAAGICRFWHKSQISEACNYLIYAYMHEVLGIRFYNTGLASGTLKAFKVSLSSFKLDVFRKTNKIEVKSSLDNLFE